ncbi:iron-hydroxamate ABC transporter substrate-binding protein [Planococcus sp. CPCC 101016]|uniref:iron-hydroxamate ABC transporter substrate-binding protein n=1 Tax=Planococcus sp. CPCC 101016 TaxID=2599617 RepID=UPI0011B826D0|nr:iron-hydroxamate ABC transporter substrate-binding protein [Planococcus sp. CPCC 101016]TWT06346.1 iron-hydroxamate ABC transporter substrate-binding protein [Planococcus sp. CPCC 101016]
MKKLFLPLFLFALLLILGACNSDSTSEEADAAETDKAPETITYESESGPVEVPADPQRVIVLSSYTGDVLSLDVPLVGVDSWSKNNPRFEEELKDVEEVADTDLEKIIELEPDLILGGSTLNNIDKLSEIAPTVTFTYGKLSYLDQHLAIGKVLNKEKEAQAWITDFQDRAQQAGEDIRAKIGEETTVSVIENFDKQIYVFGDNWGRGTEILYQEMKLKMPAKVEEMALADGYYMLSQEVLPEYMGDYVIFSKDSTQDNSFQETDLYKNTPAAKNGQIFEANAKEFYFNDPITLEYQLEFFIENFLGK